VTTSRLREDAVKAVIFDFDGPIFDGRKAAQTALSVTYEEFATSVGRPRQTLASAPLFAPPQMIAAAYAEFDLPREKLDEIRKFYVGQLIRTEHESIVPSSVIGLLDGLLSCGRKLAILSGRTTDNVTELLKYLGLFDRFAAIFGSDGSQTYKLDPKTVPEIAARLGLQARDLLLVGDSDIDYRAAQTASIPYYHAAWTGEPTGEAHLHADAIASSVADLALVLDGAEPLGTTASAALPESLLDAVRLGEFSVFAGAGASVPSGIGGWGDHYLPILRNFCTQSLIETHTFPETVQLVSSEPSDASALFDRFRDSFRPPDKRANVYHYALLKSHARIVWTTNYDQLFERAISGGGFDHTVVKNDIELLKNFGAKSLVVKMNGDFESAQYRSDLDWDMVFLEEQFDRAEFTRREIWRLFEDTYRNKLIVFIGVSFKDPTLRRILSVAAKAVPRTRYWHLLLMKDPKSPLERMEYRKYGKTLERRFIRTLFFREFADIEHFICTMAMRAHRPIVGYSGTAKPPPPANGGRAPTEPNTLSRDVAEFCARSARALAAQNFRITSGHGEGVGVPAVSAAFEQRPTSARFYLRSRGTSTFSRTAPAIVVPGDSLADMRQRFLSELDLLIAAGGERTSEPTSGTIEEIKLAISKQVPVLIVPQAGGDAASFVPELERYVRAAFADTSLAEAICTANAKIAAVSRDELLGFAVTGFPDLVNDLVARLMGAAMNRPRDALVGGPGSDW
jgi:phosphoglycolate phosphatase-like HAD superfamily hydrolase